MQKSPTKSSMTFLRAPTAGLIIVGNEILSGRTQDTNSQYIAQKVAGKGITLQRIVTLPDRMEDIIENVKTFRQKYTYVFMTGGIGPTHDDITAEAVSEAFHLKCVVHEKAKKLLEQTCRRELLPAELKMACMPEGAKLIPNPITVAPGFQVENVFVMAGVPHIMHAMLETVLNSLEEGPPLYGESLITDLAEAKVADTLSRIQERYPEVEIGSYPHYDGRQWSVQVVVRSVIGKSVCQVLGEIKESLKEVS